MTWERVTALLGLFAMIAFIAWINAPRRPR